MKKRFTSASVTNVGDDSGSFECGFTPSRSLLKECMALLHGMEEIPAAAYTKAVNKFASDPIIREVVCRLSSTSQCVCRLSSIEIEGRWVDMKLKVVCRLSSTDIILYCKKHCQHCITAFSTLQGVSTISQ
ncbi:hypothetical protein LOK49_LG09G00617 [Camellia lanceoleosa]|uniref:Uncharacterized protein n=1 Tax=Camellia lanceoleosa TaxID=1840588 RepID=A0ACC0GGJ4_9ERIC|nr:hypothetical protein LOK49_LG09G00617 [Camellia lanceoleosa]